MRYGGGPDEKQLTPNELPRSRREFQLHCMNCGLPPHDLRLRHIHNNNDAYIATNVTLYAPSFFIWLKERGLRGVKLVIGDKCLGMCETLAEVFPEAKYQRCTVHFYRNVFSATPRRLISEVAMMLKAIHAQENKDAARKKARDVVEKLREMKLKEAAKKVEDGIEETLTYPKSRLICTQNELDSTRMK